MDKKKAYVGKVEAQLKEWGLKIDILKAKAEKGKAEAKIKYYEKIEDLRAKQEAVRQKLQELKGPRDEAWEDVKGGIEEAVKDLKAAFKSAGSRFKKS